MKIRTEFFSFRNRVVVIVVGVTLGAVSLLYTNNMAQRLKWKEQHDVALWAHAIERVSRDVLGGTIQDPLVTDIMSNGNNIPFIIIAAIACAPVAKLVKAGVAKLKQRAPVTAPIFGTVFNVAMLILCVASLAGSTYNPFLYFRF